MPAPILAALALAALQQPDYSPQAISATIALAQCVGARAIEHARGRGTVDDAADAAIRDCAAEEQALERQLIADLGARGAGEMPELRRTVRARAVSAITEQRGGGPTIPRSPVGAWGECVGREVAARADSDLSNQEVAEAAHRVCLAEEEAARRYLVGTLGAADAEQTIRMLRGSTPDMAARYRTSRRAPGN